MGAFDPETLVPQHIPKLLPQSTAHLVLEREHLLSEQR